MYTPLGALALLNVGSGLTSASGQLAANVTTVAGRTGAVSLASTDISGLGTIATQSAAAVALTGGSINGTTIGGTTASTGAFTTLSASSTVSGTGFSTYLASPPAIGGTAPASAQFTTLSANALITASGGIMTSSTATVNNQGLWLQWNRATGSGGESDFINQKGGGSGGFQWFESTTANVLTNTMILSGTGSLSTTGGINNTAVGNTTASSGAFTTLSASSTVSGTGFSTYLASPPAIGGTTAAAGTFTGLTATSVTVGGYLAVIQASFYGGRTWQHSVDINTLTTLYGTNFLDLGTALNGPIASGSGYWFGMGAGDVTARGFELLGTSNGTGTLYFRERITNTWKMVATLSDTQTFSGAATFTGGATITGGSLNNAGVGAVTPATGAFTTLTTNADATVGSGGSSVSLHLNGAAANGRNFYYATNGSNRWAIFTDSSAEAGSNAGSNLLIGAYTDGGIYNLTPFSIIRSSGLVSINNGLALTGNSTGPTLRYPITDGGSAQWLKIGVYTAAQNGDHIRIHVVGANGYNATQVQQGQTTIYFSTSNGTSVDANGFAGASNFYQIGQNTFVSAVKWVANAAGTAAANFTLYISFGPYPGNPFYTVTTGLGTWVDSQVIGVTDPGVGSSTVAVAVENFQVWSPLTASVQPSNAINARSLGSLLGDIHYDAAANGIDMTGATDCSSAFNALIVKCGQAGGGTIHLPPGTVLCDGLTVGYSNVRIRGSGKGATTIKKSTATSDLFQIGNVRKVIFSSFDIAGNVAQTAGACFNFNASGNIWCEVSDIYMVNMWNGIRTTMTSSSTQVHNFLSRNVICDAHLNIGMWFIGAIDPEVENFQWYAKTTGTGGAVVYDSWCDGLILNRALGGGGQYGVLCENSQTGGLAPRGLNANMCIMDQASQACWVFSALNFGKLHGCYAATQVAGSIGVIIASGVTDLTWSNPRIVFCAQYGVQINGGNMISFVGGSVLACGQQTSNTYDAIIVGGSTTNLTISHMQIGTDPAGILNGVPRYGITVNTGVTNFNVTGNTFAGCGTGNLNDGSGAVTKVITGNIGVADINGTALTLSGAGTALTVTNNASIGGSLSAGSLSVSGTTSLAAVSYNSGAVSGTVASSSITNNDGTGGFQYFSPGLGGTTAPVTLTTSAATTTSTVLTFTATTGVAVGMTAMSASAAWNNDTVRVTAVSATTVTLSTSVSIASGIGVTFVWLVRLSSQTSSNGNNSVLDLFEWRSTAGTSWSSASRRMQHIIDSTPMGYIEFNPSAASNGLAIGVGGVNASPAITVSNSNAVYLTGYLFVGNGTGTQEIVINGAAGGGRNLYYQSNGSSRWVFYANGSAESGGNVGSDFAINSYTDASAFLATPFWIARSTGLVTMANGAAITGGTINNATIGATTASTGVFTTLTASTPAFADNSANVATTAFVAANTFPTFATIAALRANTVQQNATVYVKGYYAGGDAGEGVFWYNSADTTSTDNGGTIIVDGSSRRWYRAAGKELTPFHFGAKGDGTTDDTTAIQNMLNVLQAAGTLTEGAAGYGYCPAGFKFKTSASLTISTPINLDFRSWIYYTPTTGSAVIIGATAPVSSRNTGYKLYFAGLRSVNGNTASPTGIATGTTTGTVGVEIRNMQFSRLEIAEAIAFTYCGLYCNSTNNIYSGQHVQDNMIELGQFAYNGYGVLALSVSASTGATQANHIRAENIFGNFVNLQLDNATFNAISNDNIISINAMDAPASGGSACYIYSSFNQINICYLNGAVACQSVAFNNKITVGNPLGSGSTLSYNTTSGNNNWLATSTASTTYIPATVTVTSGTATQNTFGVPICVNLSVTLTPTTSGAEVCTAYVGQIASQMTTVNYSQTTAMTAPHALTFPMSIFVPPGWFWQFTVSGPGTGTMSSAYIYQTG